MIYLGAWKFGDNSGLVHDVRVKIWQKICGEVKSIKGIRAHSIRRAEKRGQALTDLVHKEVQNAVHLPVVGLITSRIHVQLREQEQAYQAGLTLKNKLSGRLRNRIVQTPTNKIVHLEILLPTAFGNDEWVTIREEAID